VAQHEVRDDAAREVQQIADARGDHVLHRRLVDDGFERVSEVLEDHDAARAGVLELVLEFARRVQRVDVNGNQAGTENRREHDRVLQHVWQHDCDTLAARQSEVLLQVAGEQHRQLVDLAIRERGAHVGVCGTLRPGIEGLLEDLADAVKRRFR
jgi:hypothetical protein